jgi:hypothetical protein
VRIFRPPYSCKRRKSRARRAEEEGAEAVFLCERRRSRRIMRAMREQLSKRAASVGNRAPAVLRRQEQRRFSSASDDEVGGSMRAMREQLSKGLRASGIARPPL